MIARRFLHRFVQGLALTCVAFAITTCTPAPTRPSAKPVGRVLLIGADGLEWSVLRPLLAQGKCPNLRKLMDAGSFGHLGTMIPTLSPILWTTIATGRTPEEHGIVGFQDADASQFTSAQRRVRAVWNITTLYEVPANVFGWWITWPAEEICGAMVSGSSATALVDKNWKPNILPDVDGQVFPKERNDDVMRLVREATSDAELARLRQRIFTADDADLGGAEREHIRQSMWSIAADNTYARVAAQMMRAHPAALNLVYFGGTDVVAHRFWRYHEPEAFAWPARADTEELWKRASPGSPPLRELLANERGTHALRSVISNYYEWFDEIVGELVAAAGPDANAIVISDHGFHAESTDAPNALLISGHHLDGPPGVILASGPAFVRQGNVDEFVRSASIVPHGNVLAIAPTLLALMGIPSSARMRERAVGEILAGDARKNGALTPVPNHDEGFRAAKKLAVPPGMDEAFKKRFDGLGYGGVDDASTQRSQLVDPKTFEKPAPK